MKKLVLLTATSLAAALNHEEGYCNFENGNVISVKPGYKLDLRYDIAWGS
jgi:hypothetical protein